MNARDFSPIECGKVAPAPTHIPAPRPQPLDAARAQPDYAGMDDMASHAQLSIHATSAASWLRDARDIQQRLAAQAAKDIDHAYYRWLAEQLLIKLQGAQRALSAGVHTDSLNKEALEGMLVLGDIEAPDEALRLSFNEFQARRAA